MKRMAWFLFLLLCVLWVARAEALGATNQFAFEDYLLVPVRVHLLSAKEKPRLTTTLTSLDVHRILGKVNGIWAQAGIQFYLESLVKDTAVNPSLHGENLARKEFRWLLELCPPETRGDRMFNVYYLKEFSVNGFYMRDGIFVKDEAVLTKVPGGITEPLPRVTAHELGHGLGLEHRQNVTNLMASGTTGMALNETEINLARATARAAHPWIEPASVVLKRADDLYAAGKKLEAKVWYEHLEKLPGVDERVKKRAREKVKP